MGNGCPQVFLPVWLQKSFEPWTVDAGGGYWINHAPDARDNWYAGWLIQRKMNERLVLGGELYHRSAETVGERGSTAFNLGATYGLDEHHHLLFSVGEGLRNRQLTNRLSAYAGYQITD